MVKGCCQGGQHPLIVTGQFPRGALAQSVEQRPEKPRVPGSNPGGPTNRGVRGGMGRRTGLWPRSLRVRVPSHSPLTSFYQAKHLIGKSEVHGIVFNRKPKRRCGVCGHSGIDKGWSSSLPLSKMWRNLD